MPVTAPNRTRRVRVREACRAPSRGDSGYRTAQAQTRERRPARGI